MSSHSPQTAFPLLQAMSGPQVLRRRFNSPFEIAGKSCGSVCGMTLAHKVLGHLSPSLPIFSLFGMLFPVLVSCQHSHRGNLTCGGGSGSALETG